MIFWFCAGTGRKWTPYVRVYRCPACGLEVSCGENAAINLPNETLTELARLLVKPEGFTAHAAYHRTT